MNNEILNNQITRGKHASAEIFKPYEKETIKKTANEVTLNNGKVIKTNFSANGLNTFYDFYEQIEKFGKLKLLRLDVPIVDHCNLNCASCFHCSSVAPERFYDLEEFKVEMANLAKWIDHDALQIHIMGGEPLLHPQVLEFVKVVKQHFDFCAIITNGLLLPKMPDSFFEELNSLDAPLSITKYPLTNDAIYEDIVNIVNTKINWADIQDRKELCNPQLKLWDNRHSEEELLRRYRPCRGGICLEYKDNYIYKCPFELYTNEFVIPKFNIELPDWYDFKANGFDCRTGTWESFQEWVTTPSDFCNFCFKSGKAEHDATISPWHVSECIPEEWLNLKKD